MARMVVHFDAGSGGAARQVEEQLVVAFEQFLQQIEQIEGHGMTDALFDGHTGFHRHRGTDQTMTVTEEEAHPAAADVGKPFQVAV